MRYASPLASLPVVVGLALVCACDEGDVTSPLPPTRVGGAALRLAVQQAPSALVVGQSAEILVAVARDGIDAFDGEVELTADAGPNIAIAPVLVSRLTTTVPLTLRTSAERKHGDVRVIVRAASRDPARPARGELSVDMKARGVPGALDTSFAAGGIFTLGEPTAEATGAAVQPDGKVVLGGRIGSDAYVVRLNVDGTPDGTFGEGGRARAPVPNVLRSHDVLLAGDAIVLGGAFGSPPRTFLARFGPDGAPASDFGTAGVWVADTLADSSAAVATLEGRLVVGGAPTAPGANGLQLLRLAKTGLPDASFGAAGQVFLPLDPCPVAGCRLTAIAPKAEERLTICATRTDGAVLRELALDGTSDPIYAQPIPAAVMDQCSSIVNNSPLDVYLAGRKGDAFAIAHFDVSPTGGPAKHDIYFTSFLPPLPLGPATRVAIGGPGYIVAAGTAQPSGEPTQFALVRLLAYGAPDPKFNSGKSYVTTAIGGRPAIPGALAVGPDGRIVVAGTNGDLVAARYWQ